MVNHINKNKRLIPVITLLFVLLLLPTFQPAKTEAKPSWSGQTHGWLMRTAISLLPEPWKSNFNQEIDYFLENGGLPDAIRSQLEESDYTEYMKEAPRHYVDADVRPELYGNETYHPQPTFSTSYNPSDPRQSSDYQLGVAPWAVENWTIILTERLQTYSWDSEEVLSAMCMVGHYLQDSWMPFHSVSYYDGQVVPSSGDDKGLFYDGGSYASQGGQSGIHGLVENTLIQQFHAEEVQAILDGVTGEAKYVNPYMASLRGIQTGKEVADEILAVAEMRDESNNILYQFGSKAWLDAVWEYTGGEDGSYTKRLINASIETANIWYTALVDAGLIEETTTVEDTTEVTNTTTTLDSTTTDTSESLDDKITPWLEFFEIVVFCGFIIIIRHHKNRLLK